MAKKTLIPFFICIFTLAVVSIVCMNDPLNPIDNPDNFSFSVINLTGDTICTADSVGIEIAVNLMKFVEMILVDHNSDGMYEDTLYPTSEPTEDTISYRFLYSSLADTGVVIIGLKAILNEQNIEQTRQIAVYLYHKYAPAFTAAPESTSYSITDSIVLTYCAYDKNGDPVVFFINNISEFDPLWLDTSSSDSSFTVVFSPDTAGIFSFQIALSDGRDTLFHMTTFAVTNIFTVTYNKNDSAAVGTMDSQNITGGSSANLTLNIFSKTGWNFAGWATVADGPAQYSDGASFTMGTEDVTLYAIWNQNPELAITFNK
ncbi:MAG: hypothetical protein GF401_01010, partial [Chitinivibrionales bacterium]|nr:hypothetical protein [Chitinivibrionales bacterium]